MSPDSEHAQSQITPQPLREVALLFLKLGFIGFGGPAAHIAMMRDEVVRRRQWLSDQEFLDMVGATNIIPGPNSTEMAIHLGYRRAGWMGYLLGGVLFILPAAVIVLAISWAYVRYGSMPQVEWLLFGIKPVIIAVVLQALWELGKRAVKGLTTLIVGASAIALSLIGFNEVVLLVLGAFFVLLMKQGRRFVQRGRNINSIGLLMLPLTLLRLPIGAAPFSMITLFLNFLKIGSVLYGSGYVLLAFIRADFVERLGWLTNKQLLDAIAIGQFTPGPVFTTATFVGYLLGGFPGAALATIGIFLPAFIFVALLSRLLPLVRRSSWAGALLDGVNVASMGLMAAVSWQLGRAAIVDWFTAALGLIAAVVLFKTRLNSAWVVLGGGVLGVAYRLVL